MRNEVNAVWSIVSLKKSIFAFILRLSASEEHVPRERLCRLPLIFLVCLDDSFLGSTAEECSEKADPPRLDSAHQRAIYAKAK